MDVFKHEDLRFALSGILGESNTAQFLNKLVSSSENTNHCFSNRGGKLADALRRYRAARRNGL